MKEKFFKVLITTIGSILSSVLGILYVPVLLMVGCNIIDYITGLMAAGNRGNGKVSSYKSIRGIAKKIGMWMLVMVGAMVDVLLKYASTTLGYKLPFSFLVAAVVAIWIICNELISILENLIDIGVAIPPFMLPLIKHIKSYTESTAGYEDKSSGNEKDKENEESREEA